MEGREWDRDTYIVTALRDQYRLREYYEPLGLTYDELDELWGHGDEPPLDVALESAMSYDRIHARGNYYIFGPDPQNVVERPEKTFHAWLKTFIGCGFDDLNPSGRPVYDFAHDWQYDPDAIKGRAITYEQVFDHLDDLNACPEALAAFDYAWASYWTGKTPAST